MIDHPELTHTGRKFWQVTDFDTQTLTPARWRFDPPRVGSRSPIVLQLGAPISSVAETLIAIRGPDGSRIVGSIALEGGETIFRFTPAQPWRAGDFAVVVHPDVEDAAGNRQCAPFEVTNASRIQCEQETVLPFAPLAAAARL